MSMHKTNAKGSGQLQRSKGNHKPPHGQSAINPKMKSKPKRARSGKG